MHSARDSLPRSGRAPVAAALTIAVAAALASEARADVTIEQRMTVAGPGAMRLANMTGTMTTIISGDRSRTESALRFESALMRGLARGAAGQSIEIVSLGEDRIWQLDPDKRTYTETTFTQQRAELQKNIDALREAQATQQQGASGVDEASCEWLPPTSEVRRTGERQSIAGYRAERVMIAATQSCRHRETAQVCQFSLTLDNWIAPDFRDSDEALRYQQAYAEKLGLKATSSRDFAERAEAMFGRYESIWKEIAVKMQEVEGYSVKTSFALGVGGPDCETAGAAASTRDAQPSIGGAIVQGALGGLGGMLNRGRRNEQPQQAAAPATTSGELFNLMSMSIELLSVRSNSAPAGAFEVPAGYRRVAAE